MLECWNWYFVEKEIMPTKIPNTSKDRKHLLRSFSSLPSKNKQMLRKATGHLRWLTILWDLDEPDQDSMTGISEKRHILLAYKLLQMLWFEELPESNSQAFTIYVRDHVPEDQSPERINEVFDRSTDELGNLCVALRRPKWLNNATAVMTSIELFPQRSQ